jgi:hypothetical protein
VYFDQIGDSNNPVSELYVDQEFAVDENIKVGSVSAGKLNSVQYLDNNDPSLPEVDTYLNNDLSDNDVVYIMPGTHTCSELTPSAGTFQIIWEGTVEPDGDHPVMTTPLGGERIYVHPIGESHIDTRNQGASYTSDALNVHCRWRCRGGFFGVTGTGRRAVNIEQVSGSNTNRSLGQWQVSGDDEGEVGLMVDNPSGNAVNVNAMRHNVGEAKGFTEYGVYINAGIGNRYYVSTGRNNTGTAWYAGGGPRGAAGTTHADIIAQVFSDSSNTNSDEFGSGIGRCAFSGNTYGKPTDLPNEVEYKSGSGVEAFGSGHNVARQFRNTAANNGSESVNVEFVTGSGTATFRYDGLGQFSLRGAVYYPRGGLQFYPEDLTTRAGTANSEIAIHDGSSSQPEGWYQWDGGAAEWVKVEDRSVTF